MKKIKKISIVCSSASLDECRYYPNSKKLCVDFKSGTTYRYKNVPDHIIMRMLNSSSKGTFFNLIIKSNPKYPYERIK